jgi:hypothetical protein
MRQVAGYGASGDDTARFLRELRQLRDGAGLGHAELAARAHFPFDSIRAAEIGPALPDLPVLSAYVRACGGTTEEWEERWRSLSSSPSLPLPTSRHAGNSDAATAGARIGAVSQAGDNPDPSIIIAALNRVAEEMASPNASTAAPSLGAADEFPSAEAAFPPAVESLPPAPEPFSPAPEPFSLAPEHFPLAPEPSTNDRPAGWDPIRVSTAWPAIRDTPTPPADPASSAGPAVGAGSGVPWGKAPWDEGPLDAAPAAAGRAGSPPRPAGAPPTSHRAPAAGAGIAPAASTGSAGQSTSWTRVAVIAAVLICVVAVLLAVFA